MTCDALVTPIRRRLRAARTGPVSARTTAAAMGLGFFLLMAGWALITPMNATDEAAQVVKAAATVRLQNLGTIEHVPKTVLGASVRSPLAVGEVSVYRVPASFDVQLIPCFSAGAANPACAQPMNDSGRIVSAISYVGNYDPVYYLLIGWPTLLLLGAKCVYLMRLCSALLNALLLGLAARTALETRRPRRALLSLAAAATPMTLFFGGIVNPNGTEICAAMLVWSVVLRLATATEPVPEVARGLAGRAAFGLFLLLSLRMLGPLWVGLIAVAGWWVARPATRRALLRCRTVRIGALFSALLAAGSLLWTRLTPIELVSLGSAHPGFARAARLTLDLAPRHLREMLFSYDWAEVQVPMLACVLLTGTLALLLAPLLAERRYALPFLAMAVGVVAIPVILQGYEMHALGMVWQGRYLLPYATGLVLLAGFADLDVHRAAPELAGRALEHWLGAFVGISGLTCFWWAVRRNANRAGIAGSLLPRHVRWSPPMTWPGAVLPYLLGAALVGWALWRCTDRAEAASHPEPADAGLAPVPPQAGGTTVAAR
ncbi:MAG TPA: DUF2142 domain-containing protein [Actinospica sp.]|nr:DUF2142 domain-containing protein [Actinospica sp.]